MYREQLSAPQKTITGDQPVKPSVRYSAMSLSGVVRSSKRSIRSSRLLPTDVVSTDTSSIEPAMCCSYSVSHRRRQTRPGTGLQHSLQALWQGAGALLVPGEVAVKGHSAGGWATLAQGAGTADGAGTRSRVRSWGTEFANRDCPGEYSKPGSIPLGTRTVRGPLGLFVPITRSSHSTVGAGPIVRPWRSTSLAESMNFLHLQPPAVLRRLAQIGFPDDIGTPTALALVLPTMFANDLVKVFAELLQGGPAGDGPFHRPA
ncbi:hypothetical protein L1887_59949 [Cichorium endivia]|nr:hypothetical protein L1887_59949 [Cichorium endivia]